MRFHLYFGPNFHFWGTALGRFSSLVNLGGRHVCLAPLLPPPPPSTATIKKPPTALLGYIYNDFAVNLFLKYSSCTCQEKLPGHAEEPNVAKQLV